MKEWKHKMKRIQLSPLQSFGIFHTFFEGVFDHTLQKHTTWFLPRTETFPTQSWGTNMLATQISGYVLSELCTFILWRNFFIRSHTTRICWFIVSQCISHWLQYNCRHGMAPKKDLVIVISTWKMMTCLGSIHSWFTLPRCICSKALCKNKNVLFYSGLCAWPCSKWLL